MLANALAVDQTDRSIGEETYGVLGIAAGLLFGFFLFGRTAELAATLNATLAEERRRRVPQ